MPDGSPLTAMPSTQTVPSPSSCIPAISASDLDSNGYLNEIEFLLLAQMISGCTMSVITQSLNDAFVDLRSRGCIVAPSNETVNCWQPPQPGVFIRPAFLIPNERSAIELNFLTEICQLINDVVPDDCVHTPTMTPSILLQEDDIKDFVFCTEQLLSADQNNDEVLDQDEYLIFLQHHGQCPELQSLNIGHQAVFLTLASECTDANCALPGNAKLNISGAAISMDNRTDDQNNRLVRVCRTAWGLTKGEKCVKSPIITPATWCSESLVVADTDDDGFLGKEEYLMFMRHEYRA